MACVEISFHGFGGYLNTKKNLSFFFFFCQILFGGYMKEAFWICSLMSSSSLKGKVPERET